MNNIKSRLVLFDFDGTLCSTPEDEVGRQIWLEKTGKPYPHIGWWGKPESLSMEVFDIQPLPLVLERYNTCLQDTIKILLTNRMVKLKSHVEPILEVHNLTFDYLSFKYDNKNKGQRVDEFLKEHKGIIEVDFYDDMEKHLDSCQFLLEKYPHIQFNFFLVKNNKIIRYQIYHK